MSGVIVHKVRSWVTSALAADPSFSDWDTAYAWSPAIESRRLIFTSNGEGQLEPASMKSGRNYRNELGTFVVVFHYVGPDAESANEVATDAGSQFEEWVSDHKNPGASVVPGLNWIRLDSFRLEGGPTDGGFVASLQYTLRYSARNT